MTSIKKMEERRRFKRIEIDVAIRCKLVDPQKKMDVSGEIIARAKNLSEGGALLEWPRSWPCDVCFNCLGWIYNLTCKLKERGIFEEGANKDLIPEMHISLHLAPARDLEPVSALAKVAWVKMLERTDIDTYQVGVSFIEGQREKPDLRKKIAVIKKRFEAS